MEDNNFIRGFYFWEKCRNCFVDSTFSIIDFF